MLKKQYNEMILSYKIIPKGPILIKSGVEGGADPTLPDMNFVRTNDPATGKQTVYLPGSSIKGMMRSYAEKIMRTLNIDMKDTFDDFKELKDKDDYIIYKKSCPITKLFGSPAMASRIKFTDAYPVNGRYPTILQRTNVAINRLLGSVQAGPFNMEVVTDGSFSGKIYLRNFELWMIGLIGLVFKDLRDEKIKIGYAKTRGLGDVTVELTKAEIYYIDSLKPTDADENQILGIDSLLTADERTLYGVEKFEKSQVIMETIVFDNGDDWDFRSKQTVVGEDVWSLFKECFNKQFKKLIQKQKEKKAETGGES
ncbi:MAG: RAMP superfamily CRISPR-associated protein [Promethearchaeota archaeon]